MTSLETAIPLAVVYAPNVSNTSKKPIHHNIIIFLETLAI